LTGSHLSLVVVPGSTAFIAGNAFPRHCAVTSVWADSDAELNEWNLRHRSGWNDAFERKLWGRGESARKQLRYD
jgi:hypothetical protein